MVVSEVDAMPDLVELVALGVGIALLPPRALQLAGDRAVGLTTDPSITRDLLLVTPLDREPSPAAAAFLELFDPESQTDTRALRPRRRAPGVPVP
jgi:DNA-binding transcriptional LysR family regulator